MKDLQGFAIIQTLNGNFILKSLDKIKENDSIEIELYAENLEDAKKQFSTHKKELKKAGLI